MVEIISRTLKDSAADANLKLLGSKDTFGVFRPGGEKRIHIGSSSQKQEFDNFFFPNHKDFIVTKVSKIDLVNYLLLAKVEYEHPQQQYRMPIKDYYNHLLEETLSIEDDIFDVCFERNVDPKRYYLSPEKKGNYKYINRISLPLITQLKFIRIPNGNDYTFFLKPEFIRQEQEKETNFDIVMEKSLQKIYYGAPGTGKSYEIDRMTNKDNSIRITFHPDTDYASFVGSYKPTMVIKPVMTLSGTEARPAIIAEESTPLMESTIAYKFVPQALLLAYVKAWESYFKDLEANSEIRPFYLVIEEINRGNCAQIFGDMFQLLDRSNVGYSSYSITPDIDIQQFLENDERGFLNTQFQDNKKVKNDNGKHIATFEDVKNGTLMVLPPNLHILATMNTSDQSLFPIDSAFKRRWDWKYMKIKDAEKGWKIDFPKSDESDERIDWWSFIQRINLIVSDMTSSADKQLGYFFCKPNQKISEEDTEFRLISQEKFVDKVLFYLWNDVFKDYGFDDAKLFKYTIDEHGKEVEKEINFPDFYNDDNSINTFVVNNFINNVLIWDKNAQG